MRAVLVGRVLSLALAVGVLLSVASPAGAAGITSVGPDGSIRRTVGFRANQTRKFWVSRSDCLSGDIITFPMTMSGYQGLIFQVWAGATDCTAVGQRVPGTAAQCWQVYQNSYTKPDSGSNGFSVSIFARNIVAQTVPSTDTTKGGTITEAPASVCDKGGAQQPLALYFMLVDPGGVLQGTALTWQATTGVLGMGYDVAAPAPPTGIVLGGGEGVIHATWTSSSESDIIGYNLYCDPPPGALVGSGDASVLGLGPPLRTLALDAGGIGAGGASGSGGTSPADAAIVGSGGVAGAAGAGGTTGVAGAGGIITDGGASQDASVISRDAGLASQNCTLTTLAGGTDPDPKYLCGHTTGNPLGTGTGIAKNLVNGVSYVVAVGAVDTVGNVGKLSPNQCETPVEITDFFELYRDLGGQGGCSLSPGKRTSAWLVAAVSALVSVTRLRRKQRRS